MINDRGSVSMNAIDVRWIELRLSGANYWVVGIDQLGSIILIYDYNIRPFITYYDIDLFEILGFKRF